MAHHLATYTPRCARAQLNTRLRRKRPDKRETDKDATTAAVGRLQSRGGLHPPHLCCVATRAAGKRQAKPRGPGQVKIWEPQWQKMAVMKCRAKGKSDVRRWALPTQSSSTCGMQTTPGLCREEGRGPGDGACTMRGPERLAGPCSSSREREKKTKKLQRQIRKVFLVIISCAPKQRSQPRGTGRGARRVAAQIQVR